MTKGQKILFYSVPLIVCFYFLFLGLWKAKVFLAPLLTALILTLVVLPLSQKMESKKLKRSISSLLNTILLFLISLGFVALISFQLKSFVDNWSEIKETMKPKVEQFQSFVFENTPMGKQDLEQFQENSIGYVKSQGQKALAFFNKTVGFMGLFLLTFIYIFFLLNYRRHLKEFILLLFSQEKKEKVREIIYRSAKVAQGYLIGKLMLMGILAVVYSIGLGISGVSNFILVSIIAALLTLIPYFGNIIGFLMALTFGYLNSGETSVLIGVLLTFSIAQFLESYVLEPYVIGEKVDLHPFFVILAVIIGNLIWGIIGMILAIPIIAIVTVIFLHVPPLKPYGFLLRKKHS